MALGDLAAPSTGTSRLYTNADLNAPTEFGQAVPADEGPQLSPASAEHAQFLANWDPTTGPTGDPKDTLVKAAQETLDRTAPLQTEYNRIDADTAAANAQSVAENKAQQERGQTYWDVAKVIGLTGAGLGLEAAPALPGVPAAVKTVATNVLGRGLSAYEGYKLGGIPGAVAGGFAPEILKTVLPGGLTSRIMGGLKTAAETAPEAAAVNTAATEAGGDLAGGLNLGRGAINPGTTESAVAEAAGPVRNSSEVRAFGGLGPGKTQVPNLTGSSASDVRDLVSSGYSPEAAIKVEAGSNPQSRQVLRGLVNAVGDNRLANMVGNQAAEAEQAAREAVLSRRTTGAATTDILGPPRGDLNDLSALTDLHNRTGEIQVPGTPQPAFEGPEADNEVNDNLLSPLDRVARLARARALGRAFRTGTPLPPEQ